MRSIKKTEDYNKLVKPMRGDKSRAERFGFGPPIERPCPEKTEEKIVYVEPADYIPEELRKEFKLGEYAEDPDGESVEDGDGGR